MGVLYTAAAAAAPPLAHLSTLPCRHPTAQLKIKVKGSGPKGLATAESVSAEAEAELARASQQELHPASTVIERRTFAR